jgi:ribosomal protein S12 methylthiotransferase accessory factor
MIHPMLKSHWRAHVLPPNHLVLLSEDGHHLFTGEPYVRLAQRIDGRLTDDEAVADLERVGIHPFAARLALGHFQALGLLDEPSSGRLSPGESALWHSLGQILQPVTESLDRALVTVQAIGGSHSADLQKLLEGVGVKVALQRSRHTLSVVVTDDYLDPALAAVNRAQLQERAPWMLVKLVGSVVWIGPLFLSGLTGCWECLAQRLRLNRQTERMSCERSGLGRPPQPATPWSIRLAAAAAAAEIKLWLATGCHPGLEGVVATLDLKDNSLVRHRLTRRPQCTACGTGRSQPAFRFSLGAAPKRQTGDGREQAPEAVIEKFAHHVSPITGVIRSFTELAENGFVQVAAAQSFPMFRYDFRVLRDNVTGRSGGKGTTVAQAKAGALGESLERYSGIWQTEDSAVAATQSELGHDAVNLADCLGFSARQYAERDAWNAINDDQHAWVPIPFDPQRKIDWVPFWSMTQERPRFLPAAFAYYGHPDLRYAFCASDSNGCAAGGSPAEAIAHALLEVVERDAVALWWYNRVRRPAVCLERAEALVVRESVGRHRAEGRDVWALDLTSDVGVPVVAAVSARVDHAVEDLVYGFGADFDPSSALEKAVLEMDQTHFWASQRAPDGSTRYRTDRPLALRWFRTATRANQPYLVPGLASARPSRAWEKSFDWRVDVERSVDRLRELGLEVLVLDQTRPDIGLPVFRVVVPGMCHFWRRFGCRRLYDVPVKLGWRETPCPEEGLNPWNIYF